MAFVSTGGRTNIAMTFCSDGIRISALCSKERKVRILVLDLMPLLPCSLMVRRNLPVLWYTVLLRNAIHCTLFTPMLVTGHLLV